MNDSQPKVLLLTQNNWNWSAKDVPHLRESLSGIESWALACNGDCRSIFSITSDEIKNYDIVIGNTFPYDSDLQSTKKNVSSELLLKLAESRKSNVVWVTLIEGSATNYLKPLNFIRKILDASDLINCINIHSLDYFRSMTKSRVEFLGIPYPAEGVARHIIPIEKRKKEIFLSPMLTNRWNEYFAAKETELTMSAFAPVVSRKWRNIWPMLRISGKLNRLYKQDQIRNLINDPKLNIINEVPLESYYGIVSNFFLWINLDDRYTWGRYVLDAAALKIPIISTKSTGHSEEFYPETTLENEFQIEKAISLMKRLISDKEFYNHVCNYPVGKLEKYNFESMKNKLYKFLNI